MKRHCNTEWAQLSLSFCCSNPRHLIFLLKPLLSIFTYSEQATCCFLNSVKLACCKLPLSLKLYFPLCKQWCLSCLILRFY